MKKEPEMNIYTCSCKAYKLRIAELEHAFKEAVETLDKNASAIRVLKDVFDEVKDGELNGKYILNRHRFLVNEVFEFNEKWESARRVLP